MPFSYLPAGEEFQSFSERDKTVKIYLFNDLAKTVFQENIYDLSDTVNISVCVPVFQDACNSHSIISYSAVFNSLFMKTPDGFLFIRL